jgi:hypothetical protein
VPRRTLELPKLSDESWRDLRRLIFRHGYDELLRALRLAQMIDILEPANDTRVQDDRDADT